MKKLLTLLLILIACSNLHGQDSFLFTQKEEAVVRPVSSSLLVSTGQGKIRDTYLTNLMYDGNAFDIRFERTRLMRSLKWDNHQWIDVDFIYNAMDKEDLSSMHAGRLRYRYGMHRKVYEKSRLKVSLGWTVGADIGFNYNLKMAASNNPVNVRALANTGISAKARYGYKLRRQPCTIDLQLHTPLLGTAFVPEYGASYYETFYLEHVDKMSYFTSLHNQQDFDMRLSTDIPFSVIPHMTRFGSSLRVGMAYHIETMDINHIITRQSTFQFVIGWTWQYLPYNPARR